MTAFVLDDEQERVLEGLLAEYEGQRELIEISRKNLLRTLEESSALEPHVHSFRSRLKESSHLRDKLVRKMQKCEEQNREFDITPDTLLQRITDLAGLRILHLYTKQIRDIDPILREILAEQSYELIQGPFARTWDLEYQAFYEDCGIATEDSASLYTSVHYVVGSASRTTITCEIQVRTLMEEVWGEVDHTLNYPTKSEILACREQLKVLARMTSASTRLVDSIFTTLQGE